MAAPERTFRVGPCSATIFRNKVSIDGEVEIVPVVRLQRSFRAPDGQYRSTSSFKASHVPQAILALQKAYEYLLLRTGGLSDAREEARGSDDEPPASNAPPPNLPTF